MKEQAVKDRAQAPGERAGSTKALVLFLATLFIVWSLRATVFYSVDESIHSELLKGAYSNAVKFALWVLPSIAYVALVDKREPLRFLKITTPVEGKRLLYAGIAIALFFAGVLVFERFNAGKTLAPLFESSAREWLLALGGVAFSPVSEEILYRGFVLNEFRERIGFWSANLLTSFLFVLIHWPHWLWATGFKPWMAITSVTMFILSLFLGYLVKLADSIWPAVAAHILNNFVAGFLRP